MKHINRRKFLELTSVLSGTTVMATTMPWFNVFNNPAHAGNNASDRVRLGFIGVGSRGSTLIRNVQEFQDRKNVEIAAVCDIYEPHLEAAIELTGGAEGFLDYRDLLETMELDGVVIATPLHEHAHQTVNAMKAGCHVYCEKAMARHLEDVKWMYDAHREEDKVLLIGHQRLFSPVYLDALTKINEGELGQITMLRGCWTRNREWVFYEVPGGRGTDLDRQRNWRLYDEYSAGMISELGSHHFQVANWVLGEQPQSVMGRGSLNYWKDGREVHDNFQLVFEYPDDIQFSYDCLSSNRHNGVQMQVMGNMGTMELESNSRYYEDPPEPPAIRKMLADIESSLFETVPIGGATWVPAEAQEGGEYISEDWEMNETLLYLEGFVEFIRKGEAPEKLTLEGYNASTWTLLAEEAIKTGEKITLPDDYLKTATT